MKQEQQKKDIRCQELLLYQDDLISHRKYISEVSSVESYTVSQIFEKQIS